MWIFPKKTKYWSNFLSQCIYMRCVFGPGKYIRIFRQASHLNLYQRGYKSSKFSICLKKFKCFPHLIAWLVKNEMGLLTRSKVDGALLSSLKAFIRFLETSMKYKEVKQKWVSLLPQVEIIFVTLRRTLSVYLLLELKRYTTLVSMSYRKLLIRSMCDY